MAIDATDTHFLECTKYKESPTGGVAYYLVQAIPKKNGIPQVIHIKPNELASCSALKKVLLNHCILYTATRAEHDKNLKQLFKHPPQAARVGRISEA